MKRRVPILGAGLAGSLLAIVLARRGLEVTVYERLPDLRSRDIPAGRSINLALAERGLRALERAGVREAALPFLIPMRGRMLHDLRGELALQPYGRRASEVIYSVSRAALTQLLIETAETRHGVQFHFERSCSGADLTRGELYLRNEAAGSDFTVPLQNLFAADGAGSVMRRALERQPQAAGFVCREESLGHCYKELTIPPAADAQHRIDPHALHIWPRGEFMLIALPNLDGSFTVTLFLPAAEFEHLSDPARVEIFAQQHFPDALPLIPELRSDFFRNPTGSLGTVRCAPWYAGDRVCLVGDAAHAIVPFHGQGMNCAFEDCTWIDRLLDEHKDWQTLFAAFSARRKPDTDAIARMALENYVEMRDTVRHAKFHLRKAVAWELEGRFPNRFIPRYSMVMFHAELPYAVAERRGAAQAEILEELTREADDLAAVDWERAAELVEDRLEPVAEAG